MVYTDNVIARVRVSSMVRYTDNVIARVRVSSMVRGTQIML